MVSNNVDFTSRHSLITNGRSSSTVKQSLEKRFKMLPMKLLSKKPIVALRMFLTMALCKLMEAVFVKWKNARDFIIFSRVEVITTDM